MPRNQSQIQELLDQEYPSDDPRRGRELRLHEDQRYAPWASEMPALPPRQSFENLPQNRSSDRPDQPRVLAESERQAAQAIAGAIMTPYQVGAQGAKLAHQGSIGDYQGAGLSALELAALLVPGAKTKGLAGKPAQSLEQLVEHYQSRPSVFDYRQYLDNPGQVVGNRDRRLVTQEPDWKRNGPPKDSQKVIDKLNDPAVLDHLRELRDAGLYSSPWGHPVAPWYWPAPLWKAWSQELGPELAHERLGALLDYAGPTSAMTGVPRNIIEQMYAQHAVLNDIPFRNYGAGVFSGGAYPNKVNILGDIAEGRGINGEGAHKIRNYVQNLRGPGTYQPEYDFGTGERLMTPITLDSIMAREMNLTGSKTGEPDKRFKGPMYREGMKVMHKLGDEVGTADVQPPIWQSAQATLHQNPNYWDSYARVFDDVIHRVADRTGKSPDRTLKELIHGEMGEPPNIFAAAPLVPPAGVLLGSSLYGRQGDDSQ